MMNYEEFKDKVVATIVGYLPEEYADAMVKTDTVQKEGYDYDGLIILRKGKRIAPNICLNEFFEEYQNGTDMNEILSTIANMRTSNDINNENVGEKLMSWDNVKKKLVGKLIPVQGNEKYLEGKIYEKVADLAFVCNINASDYFPKTNQKDSIAYVAITDDMLKYYGVSKEEIVARTLENMEDDYSFLSMGEVMAELCGMDTEPDDIGDPMYVLTNSSKINGAAMLVVPGVMEMIREKIGHDFVILPSSIHECLIVKKLADIDEYRTMVREVNNTQVDPQDRLSDNVYYYDYNTNEIKIA